MWCLALWNVLRVPLKGNEMAGPYTITNITDVGISATASLLSGEPGRIVPEPSRVRCYANRENVNVLFDCTVGDSRVTSRAPAAVQATLGVTPVVPDNILFDTFANAGDEIVILAANTDAAASEARVTVFVTPLDDLALQRAMDQV